MNTPISGFSKLSKSQKIDWIVDTYFSDKTSALKILKQYWNDDQKLQKLHDEFIENTISNFYLPFGIAPNFKINNRLYSIPFAIEESSVVAAASKAAKFWYDRGGFKAEVISTEKIGQVHFMFGGDPKVLETFFSTVKNKLKSDVNHISQSMEKRGGGILDITLKNQTHKLANYYQLHASFETKDAMGANFINSCLEQFAKTFKSEADTYPQFLDNKTPVDIVMSILSNYVPDCLVRVEVSCKVEELNQDAHMSPDAFADKFVRALNIAEVEPYRAVTHNKGIMNGIDAVVIATGNDFRAIEAGVHAYASKTGTYTSLSHAQVKDGIFTFWMEIPLALGTVGGLTSLHPLSKLALEILQKPSAQELMQIVAVAGLAQNFAAVRSLITTGIQEGHMKMHLANILNQLDANDAEKINLTHHFKTHAVTHSAVVEALDNLR